MHTHSHSVTQASPAPLPHAPPASLPRVRHRTAWPADSSPSALWGQPRWAPGTGSYLSAERIPSERCCRCPETLAQTERRAASSLPLSVCPLNAHCTAWCGQPTASHTASLITGAFYGVATVGRWRIPGHCLLPPPLTSSSLGQREAPRKHNTVSHSNEHPVYPRSPQGGSGHRQSLQG